MAVCAACCPSVKAATLSIDDGACAVLADDGACAVLVDDGACAVLAGYGACGGSDIIVLRKF